MYNPDAPAQDQQIGNWFEFFVKNNNLKDEQCMVFAHRAAGQNQNGQKFRPRELTCCGVLFVQSASVFLTFRPQESVFLGHFFVFAS